MTRLYLITARVRPHLALLAVSGSSLELQPAASSSWSLPFMLCQHIWVAYGFQPKALRRVVCPSRTSLSLRPPPRRLSRTKLPPPPPRSTSGASHEPPYSLKLLQVLANLGPAALGHCHQQLALYLRDQVGEGVSHFARVVAVGDGGGALRPVTARQTRGVREAAALMGSTRRWALRRWARRQEEQGTRTLKSRRPAVGIRD